MSRPLSLSEWLRERQHNALRIASTKRGSDRTGWMEDAAYFARAATSVDPDGKAFGKDCCRVTTIHAFRSLVNGFRHEFRLENTAVLR